MTRLLRIGWATVGSIIERVVADRIDHGRLDQLVQIGVDEISYRRGQRYLTTVVDYYSGWIVWCAPGRNAQTLRTFFDFLGERKDSIRRCRSTCPAATQQAISTSIPNAEVCFDPFHVVRLGQRAVDQSAVTNGTPTTAPTPKPGSGSKGTRWSLLKSPEKQTLDQLAKLGEVQQANKPLYRAFLLKEVWSPVTP